MKVINAFLLLVLSVLLTACPDNYVDQDLKKLQKNKNNLPDLVKETHEGITFQISSMFSYDYSDYYAFSENTFTRSIYSLGLYFSVDAFNSREIDILKFAFDENMEDVDAVHKYCVHKRGLSLHSPFTSEKKALPKSLNLPGYFQVVEGATYEYNDSMDYFIATFQVDEQVYVMQLIGKSGNMDYLYDDFLAMLRSVH